ncbi:hypothetical protein [Cytobacillus purgationiresistens]|uniref:DUF2642 domain-containing protein n=1 Tax=Cytobacillus purgationiresistens TaxID=863449 RepID=A0ABU0AKC8_9BACI|nr:hypothetical protein [Cytobacillus purgationiresistens]MDQ0271720.1 hypothetical protein [Cytobacillus purgationiresistens]MDQ0271732.1 hypothetical protein [Cytobacillus purgationiresistens]
MGKNTFAPTLSQHLNSLIGETIDVYSYSSFTSGVLTKVESDVIVVTEMITGYITDTNEVIIPMNMICYVELDK